MELISVLMPTYNVERFVGEAVESILNQTWTNFEFIIVDDCSTDRTYDILKKYAAKDSRIRLFRNDINSKICKTLNRALSQAKGQFIVRMDGDDISEPTRFEKLYNYLERHKDVDLIGSDLITIDEDDHEVGRTTRLRNDKAIRMGNHYISSVAHSWMTRREVYDKLDGYRNIPYAEDYDLLLRGELQGFRYANLNEYLYRMRIRTGNTVSTNGLVQRKTVSYVKYLHRLESKDMKNHFEEQEYRNFISCTEEEKKKYYDAALILDRAIKNKKNKKDMLFYTVKAALSSSYVFSYLIDAVAVRIIKQMEIRGLL